MKKSLEGGSIVEGLLALTALSIVIFAILLPASARKNLIAWPTSTGGFVSFENTNNGQNYTSSSSGKVGLSSGNARYITDPMEEYIIIENRGGSNINITGWRLENGKSSKRYVVGSGYSQFASDVGIIPQATKVISPNGVSRLENVILEPNERAVVVSGSPQRLASYNVTNFKENMCTGYLVEDYAFPSGHEMSCNRPTNEAGYSNLDKECRTFINSMQYCHTPDYEGLKYDGDRCNGCVDKREGLSSMCVNFIKDHFSYPDCLTNHKGDKDFEGRVWHLYLYRPWEMWADSDETISLYDSSGKLVDSISY